MPFESGLAIAFSQDSKLANALVRQRDRPSARQLNEVYEDVCHAAQAIRGDLHGAFSRAPIEIIRVSRHALPRRGKSGLLDEP
jgi:hypothetical protein